MLGGVLLHHLLAGPAGELRAMRDDHAGLGWNNVEPLARLLADHMHRRAAARAAGARRRHRLVDTRQMLGQGAAFACTRARQPRFLLLDRLVLGERCLDVFEGELELVGRQAFEPLVPRAKAVIVGFAKKMMHMLVEALQPIAIGHKLRLLGPLCIALLDRRRAFGNRNIALGDDLRGQRAQALNIVRKRIGRRAHARREAHPREKAMHFIEGDSIDRRSLHGLRPRHSSCVHAAPIEAFEKRAQLRRRQTHHPVLYARPVELAVLQTLAQQAKARPIPEHELHPVGAFRAEAVDRAREWVGLQLLLHQSRQSVHALAEVHGLRRHQHPNRPGRDQQAAAHELDRQIARKTASTSRASAPAGTRTVTAPITSSMVAERTSCADSFACPDPIDTTGTKEGSPSPGSAKRPSLAALIQFQRCCGTRSWRRATSEITAPGAIASATIRPFASSLHRRRRTTPVTSTRRRTIFVSSLMSAIMCTRSTIPESPSCTSVATRLCGGGAPLTFLM